MKIAIIGAGHVGIVTAAAFAERGHTVTGYDIDANKVARLNKGDVPIFEAGLDDLVRRNLEAGRLSFGTDNADAVALHDVLFICVGTPASETGATEMVFVERVAREIAVALPTNGQYRLIVDKSTVPVKTGERVLQTLRRYAPKGADFDVASNPEFLREGTAVKDTLNPDRTVLGVSTRRAETALRTCYGGFPGDVIVTDVESAELIKHAANSFLATKISYINTVARICDATGADVEQVARGIGLDPRIGSQFLRAGIGYGGYCLPKDVLAFIALGADHGVDFGILREVHKINQGQIELMVDKIAQELWVLHDKRIALWGLTFKPNTDDIRESPAISLARALMARGAKVVGFDPQGNGWMAQLHPEIPLADSAEAAARDAEALVLATDWAEFTAIPAAQVKQWMKLPIVFDGRNALDRAAYIEAGFTYHAVGRPSTPRAEPS